MFILKMTHGAGSVGHGGGHHGGGFHHHHHISNTHHRNHHDGPSNEDAGVGECCWLIGSLIGCLLCLASMKRRTRSALVTKFCKHDYKFYGCKVTLFSYFLLKT